MKELNEMKGMFEDIVELSSNIIDCGLGISSHGLPPNATEAGINAIKEGICNYTMPACGLTTFRENIASINTQELKYSLSKENIIVTSGSEFAIDLIYRSLLKATNSIIIFDPYYIPFVTNARIYGINPIFVNTYDTAFQIDLEGLKRSINNHVKMIILVCPNNPTGRIYNIDTLYELVEIAKTYNIYLVVDEVYKFFTYDTEYKSIFHLYPEGIILLRSFSKEYCMMGYRVGYIIGTVDTINHLKKFLSPCWGAPIISSIMANAALLRGYSTNILEKYKEIRDQLYPELFKLGLINYKPEGSFYFYLKIPFGYNNSFEYAECLLKYGLKLAPGFSQQKKHIRLSYGALKKEDLSKVIDILKKTINNN